MTAQTKITRDRGLELLGLAVRSPQAQVCGRVFGEVSGDESMERYSFVRVGRKILARAKNPILRANLALFAAFMDRLREEDMQQ